MNREGTGEEVHFTLSIWAMSVVLTNCYTEIFPYATSEELEEVVNYTLAKASQERWWEYES